MRVAAPRPVKVLSLAFSSSARMVAMRAASSGVKRRAP
jgi:hypothetical protein